MVMCEKEEARQGAAAPRQDRRPGFGDGGPVFLPPRKLSPLAEAMLAGAGASDPVTAYDDLWYLGRPRA